MSKKHTSYFGKAGHHAVMAEYLLRGYNVGIPEVDVGDDIFVVQDSTGKLSKVQVKSANSIPTKGGESGVFNLKIPQLRDPDEPVLHYVFALRLKDKWGPFVIIKRADLYRMFINLNLNEDLDQTSIRFKYSESTVKWKSVDITTYRNNWDFWPEITH